MYIIYIIADLCKSIGDAKVWPLLAAGKCKPRFFKTFPLAEAAAAHTLMETNAHMGKIVLVV